MRTERADWETALWPALVLFAWMFLGGAILTGCAPAPYEYEFEQNEAELAAGPLTFWTYAGDDAILMPALETALWRIRNATWLPLDVSLEAAHWVRQYPPEDFPNGWNGWTTGAWASTRVRVSSAADTGHASRIMVHEIAEHILRRNNGHAVSSSNSTLTESLVSAICEVQDCGCFNPEP